MKKNKIPNYLKKICLSILFTNINLTYAKEFVIGVEAIRLLPFV